jgi:glycosyltransferase involved in cell wall biosynthesis
VTSVCLGMIVRDAETVVERCIRSCLPLVDRAVIIDTGSVDNTMQIVRDTIDGLPVTYLESDWVGHNVNRTELLEKTRASGADYTLMPDADMELIQEGPLRELTKDEYLIPIRDRGLVYPLPLLTSNTKRFFYAGVAHAYLACEDAPTEGELLEEIAFWDHGGGGGRPGKIERDRDLLSLEVGKNPADRRSWFYLAQSFRDLDQHDEAIAAYKIRAQLGGWSEEVYQSLYNAGMLLSEHVNFYDGAKLLLAAAEMKQNRAEALRALAGCATSVANKIPFPRDEVLFVEPHAYTASQPTLESVTVEVPPAPDLNPRSRRKKRAKLTPANVSAIIVTRGNVDLEPCLAELPYDDVIVWDNNEREHDYKCFGRYAAIPEAKNPVVYFQDDDIIFTAHQELLAAYEPGVLVANMDNDWYQGYYQGLTVLPGAGSICDADMAADAFGQYLDEHPFDDALLTFGDHAFGILSPSKVVDLGFEVREFADAPDRLYQQPGSTERKWAMIRRAHALKETAVAA